ncbi:MULTISPECIES: amidohydrolase family protein [unclassified Beijerinckia]|uniref:amidohydrolase family protein n=1 Tax=unclassified Beijerinckia TaxID=2638183 RepID=UPI000B843B59|nr:MULTISPECIES: amidohydrolase family protein [unclassified Beijerinckia]
MIIDVHCHVVSPDRETYPLAPIGGKQSDWSSERPTTPEQLLAAMDVAGVAKAAVVQASTAYGHNSSYLADSIEHFPQRFTGVFSIDPLDPKALEQIDHWHGLGMTGMRVFTTGSTMPGQQTWLDDERAYPVWEKAGKLQLPVAMQMTAEGIPLLLKIVKAFPETNFLLDHLARPVINDGPPYAAAASLWALADYKNIYLKITSRTVEHCQAGKATPETFMPKLVSTFGSQRLLWGSNFPAHDDTLPNIVKETLHVLASVSEADRANILSGTAQRLYPVLK